ncbi:hypothetical protein [Pseudorhodoferax soli]|uniref:Uncharacterized protein n=1 Tax=Pseudorhodoferax soli TaxID=545864 RepID=A0A368YDM7_9BURK|nr:hypothetical protein [Pseudorhodoferax soli]RCW76284.1 hypothetical protein DES41_101890 [Pseudorhodoferax soli]
MTDTDPNRGLRGFARKCIAVARAVGIVPQTRPPACLAPCPHCGEQADHAGRRCEHCGEVMTPQSKWDTSHAPLEPRGWRK